MAAISFRSFLRNGKAVKTFLADRGLDLKGNTIPRLYTMLGHLGGVRGYAEGTVQFQSFLAGAERQVYCRWTYNLVPFATLEWWDARDNPSPANRVFLQDAIVETVSGTSYNGYRITMLCDLMGVKGWKQAKHIAFD